MYDELKSLSQYFLKVKNASFRRYFIENIPLTHRLSLITGQRGIGKTVTLIQYLLDYVKGDFYDPRILYVQADHFALGSSTLYEIADHFQARGCELLAFDEIHKYPEWSKELKSIYDTFPKLTLIASGSSALEIFKGSHDLTRRALRYSMQGLSFREYLGIEFAIKLPTYTLEHLLTNHERIVDTILETLSEHKQKVIVLFNRYLKHGYYPYFKEMPDEEAFQMTLEQNLHTTLESDLVALYPHLSGSSIYKIKQLLIFIAESVPFTPSWQRIQEILDIGDIRTIKTYFHHLESARLIRLLSSASKKMGRLESIAKVYLDNPNLLLAIAPKAQNKGSVRETFFLNMLSQSHDVECPINGDFLVDKKYLFEIGGKNKGYKQIKGHQQAFCVCDDMERGAGSKIPLWLLGFLY